VMQIKPRPGKGRNRRERFKRCYRQKREKEWGVHRSEKVPKRDSLENRGKVQVEGESETCSELKENGIGALSRITEMEEAEHGIKKRERAACVEMARKGGRKDWERRTREK